MTQTEADDRQRQHKDKHTNSWVMNLSCEQVFGLLNVRVCALVRESPRQLRAAD